MRRGPSPVGPATAGRPVTGRPAVAGPTACDWVRLVMCYSLPNVPLGSFHAGLWVRSGSTGRPGPGEDSGTERLQTGMGSFGQTPSARPAPVPTAQSPQGAVGFVSSGAGLASFPRAG